MRRLALRDISVRAGARMALAEGTMSRTGAGATALRDFLTNVQHVSDGMH
jgi:hypothetical protein